MKVHNKETKSLTYNQFTTKYNLNYLQSTDKYLLSSVSYLGRFRLQTYNIKPRTLLNNN